MEILLNYGQGDVIMSVIDTQSENEKEVKLVDNNDEIPSCSDCKYYPDQSPCYNCEGYSNFVKW